MNKLMGEPNLGLGMLIFLENKKPRYSTTEIDAATTTTATNIEWNSRHQFITTAHQRIRIIELAATQKRTQQ